MTRSAATSPAGTAPLVALSLGWGLQSFGLAAMSALGVLPKVDVAIHADTTHEREATYRFAERWTPWLEERGVRVVTVRPWGDVEPIAFTRKGKGKSMIPAFTESAKGGGQITRQCTGNWKLRPIRRWLQANRQRGPVAMWLGISADEPGRAKPSGVGYIRNVWPYIDLAEEIEDRPMWPGWLPVMTWRRSDIRAWLESQRIEVPPRSACTFCPYQSRREWRALQGTPDFAKAVAVDEAIRDKRPPFALYLHASRIPLAQVDLRSEQERGQMELDGFESECSGHCGL